MESLAFAQYVSQFADFAIVVLVAINIKQSSYLIAHHVDIKVIKEKLKIEK